MLISCPECDAGYEVPDALLRTARMMRCAACGHDWMTEPLETAASAVPAGNGARPSPPPTPAPRPSAAGGPVTQQISCPNCSAVYDIPAVMLTSPRSMRCATCGHDWVTGPLSGETTATTTAATPPPPEPPTPPPPAPAAAAPQREEAYAGPVAEPETPPGEPGTVPDVLSADVLSADVLSADVLSADVLSADERAELEAMRAAQATSSQQETAEQPGSLKDRLQGGLRANAIAVVGWAATIAVLYLAARGAVDNREALVQLWPPGQRIFNWLGIS